MVFTKQPNESLDYSFDFSAWMPSGDSLPASTAASVITSSPTGLTIGTKTHTGSIVTQIVGGGTTGTTYTITCRMTTTQGRVVEREIQISVVETPASLNANAIITLPEAKVFLMEASDERDPTIIGMINSISTLIEIETSRKVVQQTVSDYRMDGNGKSSMLLPYVPLKSVSSIVIKDPTTDATLDTYTSFAVTNQQSGRVLLTNGNVFPSGKDNVVVGMSVGFAATDPELAVFKQATYRQLKNDYKRYEAQEIGLTSRSLPDGSVTLVPAHNLLLEVIEMVRPYKLRSCG